ncbi:MAG TPA: nuclear transport factor 2 family protein [Candidatus Acidoferrum sp.]|nr:nuclear transport factor 2 family protein [Candidatus Acidoferrum sp.]
MDDRRTVPLASRMIAVLSLLLALALCAASPAAAQKKNKNAPPPADNSSPLPLPDEQRVDYVISEMLGAWQLADIEKLHKDYADDVIVVNGIYAPPVIGWTNYLATYQQQRARMQRVRLDRANTYIKVDGNVAWACYQWDFSALVDEQMSASQGQTSLVLQKRDGRWLIVLNHTSLVPSVATQRPPEPNNTPKNEPASPTAKPPSR